MLHQRPTWSLSSMNYTTIVRANVCASYSQLNGETILQEA